MVCIADDDDGRNESGTSDISGKRSRMDASSPSPGVVIAGGDSDSVHLQDSGDGPQAASLTDLQEMELKVKGLVADVSSAMDTVQRVQHHIQTTLQEITELRIREVQRGGVADPS